MAAAPPDRNRSRSRPRWSRIYEGGLDPLSARDAGPGVASKRGSETSSKAGVRMPGMIARPPYRRVNGYSGSALHRIPEVTDRREEALAFRVVVLAQRLELAQELFLPAGEVDRRLDGQLDEHVAAGPAPQRRHALAPQTHLPAGLRAGGRLDARAAAVDRGDLDIAAESRAGHRDGHAAEEVGVLALEYLVRSHVDEDVEIARRPAAHAGLALARKADARPGLDPGGNVDAERAFLLDAALTAALLARILDDLADAAAGRAGTLDGEESLLRAHLAHARTGRAGRGLRAALGAGALARVAGRRTRDLDALLQAGERLFERHAEIVPQVGTARRALATTAATAAHEITEEIVEHVRERRGEIALTRAESTAPGTTAARAHAAVEGGMTVAIIGGALVGVLERLVGLAHLLEAGLGLGIILVAVGVKLFRLLAVGPLDLLVGGALGQPEHLVIIAFGHLGSPSSATRGQCLAPAEERRQAQRRLLSSRSSKSASTMSSSPEDPASPEAV